MAAVAGILIPGAIIPGFAQWFNAGAEALKGSPFPYSTLFAIELFLFGFVECKRWMDIVKPGSQGEPGSFLGFEGMLKGTDAGPGYPGGPFNPMGMGRGSMQEMQTKVRNPNKLHLWHTCATRTAAEAFAGIAWWTAWCGCAQLLCCLSSLV